MRTIFFTIGFSFLCLVVGAQTGEELMVYAIKGQATVVFNKTEKKLRIGSLLPAGGVVKTTPNAVLTLICKQGKPLQLSKAGSYPVSRWRDSCVGGSGTVSNHYFKYIWQQMYAYSPEAREKHQSDLAVVRSEPNDPGGPTNRFTQLLFDPGLDTVFYDGSAFPLSWTGNGYRGKYHFTLYADNGKDTLYTDSLQYSFIPIEQFKQKLVAGKQYFWTVQAKAVPTSRPRILIVVDPARTRELEKQLITSAKWPEDAATRSLRVAYLLEQQHFFGAAYLWYQQAAAKNREMRLYSDQLIRFENAYWIR